ncbi:MULTISPECIES: ROK family transcriptional regulator [Rhizobium/Agrobacterium group]|uniref:ROK family protein n=1 Tax=Agrobacterium vitis TaxID=373 RepID=A0ABW9TEM6_AGRVI|nr:MULTISPECIES: ROK family transcriptional regulator [Rhizobium/Agrobacterium group]MCF1495039.1 ROK family transcriptional regulator [Allorhizobium ampelinum]MCM2436249.1 ROK family transcriptional regulator [Agrobacterium rosae]MCW8059443.1 ROK family transcriptional regulator [Agrobacterium tumefaciens]MCW8145456.1 ROK family transcriptional regulator [Agrobacterium tumefaciens]MQB13278.1 ROK family transcriptional regulator [Agrobacterium sp. ICMP 6402]
MADNLSLVPVSPQKAFSKPLSQNERMILEIIRRNNGIKRSAIASMTNLTQPSVHRIIDSLIESSYLIFGDTVIEGRGKPSKGLQLNARAAYSIGISVNTDSASFCLCDLRCNVIHEEILDIPPTNRSRTLVLLKERVWRAMKSNDVPRDKLVGAGFAMAGFFVGRDHYFNAPEPLADWSLVDLQSELAALFEVPIWTENNCTTGAVGEAILGAGLTYPTFGYLSFNYGFGAGVVVDGKPVFGSFRNAGEISRIYTTEEGVHRPALGGLLSQLQQRGVVVEGIRDLRRNFDPEWPGVRKWVEEVSPFLNRAIDAMWAVIDPAAIVLGGELPKGLGDLLLEVPPTPRFVRMNTPPEYPRILLSEIEGDPAVIGAALVPLKELFFN